MFPYLEQQALYDQIDFSIPWFLAPTNLGNESPYAKPITCLLCPSDYGNKQVLGSSGGIFSLSNYLGFFGDQDYRGLLLPNPTNARAAFGINYGAAWRDFRDGTSHTMVVGEYIRAAGSGTNQVRDYRGAAWSDQPCQSPYSFVANLVCSKTRFADVRSLALLHTQAN